MKTLRVLITAALLCVTGMALPGTGRIGHEGSGVNGIPMALKECEADLENCLATPCATLPGDGWPEDVYPSGGAPLSYTDNGDGTFTDNNTGLMWEVKTGTVDNWRRDCTVDPMPVACVDVSDVNNGYDWSDPDDGDESNPDGRAFTVFLDLLNNHCGGQYWNPCQSDTDCASAPIKYCGLGGHMDWRLPTIKELQSLVDYSVESPGPTVTGELPGATAGAGYWSSTTDPLYDYGLYPHRAWMVVFANGGVFTEAKILPVRVRAVGGDW
jgi:hypothetical protein